ncbi:MAG: hypothetical protein ABH865_07660 [Candidatus Omnitrophota bacterium]
MRLKYAISSLMSTRLRRFPENCFNRRIVQGLGLFSLLFFYSAAMAFMTGFRSVPLVGHETDGVYYMVFSRALFTDHFPAYAAFRLGGGIGGMLTIRLFDTVLHNTFAAAKLVSMMAGFFYLLASWKVIARLYRPSLGLMTGWLLFVNPTVFIYSSMTLFDMLAAAFLMTAIWILVTRTSFLKIFFAGLCLGFAFAVKTIFIVFWPLIIIPVVYQRCHRGFFIKAVCMGTFGLLTGAFPQLITNMIFFGFPFYTDNWRQVTYPIYVPYAADRLKSLGQIPLNDWLRLYSSWIHQVVVWIPQRLLAAAYWLAYLAVPGYFLFLRSSNHKRVLILWGGALTMYLLSLAATYKLELRYFLPVLPLVIASGLAMWRIIVSEKKIGIIVGFLVVFSISTFATIENTGDYLKTQATEFKIAGTFLRRHASPGDRILVSQPHVLLYAHRPGELFERLDRGQLRSLAVTVQNLGIRWVVFDERYAVRRFRPARWLLNPQSKRAQATGWHLVFDNKEKPRIVIWRVQ